MSRGIIRTAQGRTTASGPWEAWVRDSGFCAEMDPAISKFNLTRLQRTQRRSNPIPNVAVPAGFRTSRRCARLRGPLTRGRRTWRLSGHRGRPDKARHRGHIRGNTRPPRPGYGSPDAWSRGSASGSGADCRGLDCGSPGGGLRIARLRGFGHPCFGLPPGTPFPKTPSIHLSNKGSTREDAQLGKTIPGFI